MSTTELELTPANARFCVLLMDRWSLAPDEGRCAPELFAEHMLVARSKLEKALGRYRPWMDASDLDLLDRILSAPDAEELSRLYFHCFDLMERKLGMARAVLQMHDLFRLLRPHIVR